MFEKDGRKYSGRVVVKLKPEYFQSASKTLKDIEKNHAGLKLEQELAGGDKAFYGLYSLKDEKQSIAVAKDLCSDKQILWADPEHILPIRFSTIPDDPYYTGEFQPQQWGPQKCNLPAMWQGTTGVSDVVIGVMDTGIQLDDNGKLSHPDMLDKTRYILGTNYIDKTQPPADDVFHGTAVTGVVAATTNNSRGIAGVNWSSPVYVVKIASADSDPTDFNILSAVQEIMTYAATNDSRCVINVSWTMEYETTTLREACRQIMSRGGVLCASSGNIEDPLKTKVLWPAAFATDPEFYGGILSVGSSNQQDQVSTFSCRGPELMCVAPGEQVITCDFSPSSYGLHDGTTYSAPHVTGLISLLWSVFPSFSNVQVTEALMSNLVKLTNDTYFHLNWGYGRLNVDLGGKPTTFSTPAHEDMNLVQQHTFYRNVAGQILHAEYSWDQGKYLFDIWAGAGSNPVAPASAGQPICGYNMIWDDTAGPQKVTCHVWYRSIYGNLEHVWYDGNYHPDPPYLHTDTYAGPKVNSPAPAGDPTLIYMQRWRHSSDNILYVFYRAYDGRIFGLWWEGGVQSLLWAGSGSSSKAPSACEDPVALLPSNVWDDDQTDSLHMFYRTNDSGKEGCIIHMWKSFDDSPSWEIWCGPSAASGAPAAVGKPATLYYGDQKQIFYRDANGSIQHVQQYSDGRWNHDIWGGPNSVSGSAQAKGDPTVFQWGDEIHLYYRDVNDNLVQIWWDGTWKPDNYLNTDIWAGPNGITDGPALASDPMGVSFDIVHRHDNPDLQQTVYYRDVLGNLQRVWYSREYQEHCWQTIIYGQQPSNTACVSVRRPQGEKVQTVS